MYDGVRVCKKGRTKLAEKLRIGVRLFLFQTRGKGESGGCWGGFGFLFFRY